MKSKLIRITTVPISLKILLKDQLRFMNQYFDVVAVSSQGKELKEVEISEGVRTIELDMSREITPLRDFTSLIKMIVLLWKEKPEIVHTHTPKAGIIGMLAAWITRVPHRLHTIAGLPVMEARGKKKSLLLAVEKITYACATKVYPNSLGLQTYVLENKLTTRDKLKFIGYGSSNGIDTEYFQRTESVLKKAKEITNSYHLEERFVFCFVGRVVKDKGVNELLFAFDKLSQKHHYISLLVVGQLEDDLDPISSASQAVLDNNDQVFYVGFQNDIRPYLAASDCFVLPTYREGFPNVVLQACSMELPCIVADINGCNEIVGHHTNGLLVEPKNAEALYGAMNDMIGEEKLATQLSSNNRNDIIKKYDRAVFHQYLLEEYNKVLKND